MESFAILDQKNNIPIASSDAKESDKEVFRFINNFEAENEKPPKDDLDQIFHVKSNSNMPTRSSGIVTQRSSINVINGLKSTQNCKKLVTGSMTSRNKNVVASYETDTKMNPPQWATLMATTPNLKNNEELELIDEDPFAELETNKPPEYDKNGFAISSLTNGMHTKRPVTKDIDDLLSIFK